MKEIEKKHKQLVEQESKSDKTQNPYQQKNVERPQIEEETGKKLAQQQDIGNPAGLKKRQTEEEKSREQQQNIEKYKGAKAQNTTVEGDEQPETEFDNSEEKAV